METKISMKTIYLLLVISIGLIGLGVGSTFAVFTASAEISNPISFSSNLSYTDNAFEIVEVVIPANSSKNVNFTVYNNSDIGEDVNYATWYIYDGTASDITFLTGTGSNVNDTSSLPSGVIDASSEGINIFLNVINNTSSDITLTMGVVTNTDDIVLPNYMKIVTLSTVSSYNLTINKSIGVGTIYYKVNGASSYTSSSSDVTVSVNYGTTYYYYGTPLNLYKMDSCTELTPCSGTMGASDETKLLSAIRDTIDGGSEIIKPVQPGPGTSTS